VKLNTAILLVVFGIFAGTAHAESKKRDLFGLAPGMTQDEVRAAKKCDFKPTAGGYVCAISQNQMLALALGPISNKILGVETTFYGAYDRDRLFQSVCTQFSVTCPNTMTGEPSEIFGMGGTKAVISTTSFKNEFDLGDGLSLIVLSPQQGQMIVRLVSAPLAEAERSAISHRNAPAEPKF
jgi:hypothetical protein